MRYRLRHLQSLQDMVEHFRPFGMTVEGPRRYPRIYQIPLDAFQCGPELTIDSLYTGVLESDRG